MSELNIILAWMISLVKIGIFGALFAFSIVLIRVSKLRELKFFAIATLSFMFSSIFELINSIAYLDSAFQLIEKNNGIILSKLFLLIGAFLLFLFLYEINKNIKNYV